MDKKFILALDQGTTSSRAILFNRRGQIEVIAQREFKQIYPKSGWVEHNPLEIWSSQYKVAKEVVITKDLKNISALGITNQRETTIIWEKSSGKPIYNAIVWQDRRTADYTDKLKKDGLEQIVQNKTGLKLDPYFSATKIKWILDNVEGARKKAENSELAFGTVDSWLMWNLTNGKIHITDVTNASRTMIFNIHKLCWDTDLLKIFDIPESILPNVVQSSEIYGFSGKGIFSSEIPISGIAGDQHAALFGQNCIEQGMVKNTYGTGCFMLMNTGSKPIKSKNNLLTTIAWKIDDKIEYALEGSVFIGGAIVQWLRDGLGLINSALEIEELATKVNDTDGVYVVPAFSGLGAPHWDPHAKGIITGITRGITSSHIARASLEAIAYQSHDLINAMENDSGIQLQRIQVDGGACSNNFLMQFQADISDAPVIRPKITETTALGAAYFAGLATGFWEGQDQISEQWESEKVFKPSLGRNEVKVLYEGWLKAVEKAKS
tara:strand:- start:37364 stop:38842 length:1479 start_codon:yes stop_codon:yes gene_type:complete